MKGLLRSQSTPYSLGPFLQAKQLKTQSSGENFIVLVIVIFIFQKCTLNRGLSSVIFQLLCAFVEKYSPLLLAHKLRLHP